MRTKALLGSTIILAVVLTLVSAACGQPATNSTTTPSTTPIPTSLPAPGPGPEPSPTPTPSPTPAATATPTLSPEPAAWVTHAYQRDELGGFAISFDTPEDWLPTGPIGERQIGGWYDPKYPKPPSPDAVWCYWITCNPPSLSPTPTGDPIAITDSQQKFYSSRVQGNWSYHIICVAPVSIYVSKTSVFYKITLSLKPLPYGSG